MRNLSAFAAIALASTITIAHADSKAWTTAKANLPGDTPLTLSVDMQAVQKSATYAKFLPLLTDKSDVKSGLEMFKTNCKADALTLIGSVTIAGNPSSDDAVVYVSLPGWDQKKVVACLQAVASAKDKTKLTVANDGNIAELSDGKSKLYVGFIGEVAVIAPKKMEDKSALKKWMTGAGAFDKGTLGKLMAKANASAAIFGGTIDTKQLDGGGMGAKSAYGSVTLTGGNFGVELHADLGDAKNATKQVDDANKQLDAVKKQTGLPAALTALLKNVTLSTSGSEAIVKASGKETDAIDAVQMLLMMAGGH